MSASTTGINKWWTYEEGAIPGVGKYMVNVGNLNAVVQVDDVDIPERGIDLALRRTYNSASQHDYNNTDGSVPSNIGNGWTSTFDAHMGLSNNGNTLSVYDIDGARYDYTLNGTTWTPPAGMEGTTITPDGGMGYYWTKKNGTKYYFWRPDMVAAGYPQFGAYAGRLYVIWARNNNNYIELQYWWDGSTSANGVANAGSVINHIIVAHSDGQGVTLQYADFSGHRELQTVTLPDGNVVTYSYDANGNLQEVEKPGNGSNNDAARIEEYGYLAPYVLEWVSSPNWSESGTTQGSYVWFTYTSGLVSGVQLYGWGDIQPGLNGEPSDGTGTPIQPWATGSASAGTIFNETFTTASGSTNLSDSDGRATTWYYDTAARVKQTLHSTNGNGSSNLVTYQQWDSNNNLIASLDPRSGGPTDTTYETNYAYDGNGNTVAVALPSVTTSQGTFRPTSLYTYDGNNNLTSFCDAVENGASRAWNGTGAPPTCPTTVGSSSSPTNVVYVWNTTTAEPFGELTDTYTPMGYHHQIQYNVNSESGTDFGLPTTVTGGTITQTDNTTRAPTQTFTYDEYGNVTSYSRGKGSWTLTYDTTTLGSSALNRLLIVKDPDGDSSYTCYFANGQVKYTETPRSTVRTKIRAPVRVLRQPIRHGVRMTRTATTSIATT